MNSFLCRFLILVFLWNCFVPSAQVFSQPSSNSISQSVLDQLRGTPNYEMDQTEQSTMQAALEKYGKAVSVQELWSAINQLHQVWNGYETRVQKAKDARARHDYAMKHPHDTPGEREMMYKFSPEYFSANPIVMEDFSEKNPVLQLIKTDWELADLLEFLDPFEPKNRSDANTIFAAEVLIQAMKQLAAEPLPSSAEQIAELYETIILTRLRIKYRLSTLHTKNATNEAILKGTLRIADTYAEGFQKYMERQAADSIFAVIEQKGVSRSQYEAECKKLLLNEAVIYADFKKDIGAMLQEYDEENSAATQRFLTIIHYAAFFEGLKSMKTVILDPFMKQMDMDMEEFQQPHTDTVFTYWNSMYEGNKEALKEPNLFKATTIWPTGATDPYRSIPYRIAALEVVSFMFEEKPSSVPPGKFTKERYLAYIADIYEPLKKRYGNKDYYGLDSEQAKALMDQLAFMYKRIDPTLPVDEAALRGHTLTETGKEYKGPGKHVLNSEGETVWMTVHNRANYWHVKKEEDKKVLSFAVEVLIWTAGGWMFNATFRFLRGVSMALPRMGKVFITANRGRKMARALQKYKQVQQYNNFVSQMTRQGITITQTGVRASKTAAKRTASGAATEQAASGGTMGLTYTRRAAEETVKRETKVVTSFRNLQNRKTFTGRSRNFEIQSWDIYNTNPYFGPMGQHLYLDPRVAHHFANGIRNENQLILFARNLIDASTGKPALLQNFYAGKSWVSWFTGAGATEGLFTIHNPLATPLLGKPDYTMKFAFQWNKPSTWWSPFQPAEAAKTATEIRQLSTIRRLANSGEFDLMVPLRIKGQTEWISFREISNGVLDDALFATEGVAKMTLEGAAKRPAWVKSWVEGIEAEGGIMFRLTPRTGAFTAKPWDVHMTDLEAGVGLIDDLVSKPRMFGVTDEVFVSGLKQVASLLEARTGVPFVGYNSWTNSYARYLTTSNQLNTLPSYWFESTIGKNFIRTTAGFAVLDGTFHLLDNAVYDSFKEWTSEKATEESNVLIQSFGSAFDPEKIAEYEKLAPAPQGDQPSTPQVLDAVKNAAKDDPTGMSIAFPILWARYQLDNDFKILPESTQVILHQQQIKIQLNRAYIDKNKGLTEEAIQQYIDSLEDTKGLFSKNFPNDNEVIALIDSYIEQLKTLKGAEMSLEEKANQLTAILQESQDTLGEKGFQLRLQATIQLVQEWKKPLINTKDEKIFDDLLAEIKKLTTDTSSLEKRINKFEKIEKKLSKKFDKSVHAFNTRTHLNYMKEELEQKIVTFPAKTQQEINALWSSFEKEAEAVLASDLTPEKKNEKIKALLETFDTEYQKVYNAVQVEAFFSSDSWTLRPGEDAGRHLNYNINISIGDLQTMEDNMKVWYPSLDITSIIDEGITALAEIAKSPEDTATRKEKAKEVITRTTQKIEEAKSKYLNDATLVTQDLELFFYREKDVQQDLLRAYPELEQKINTLYEPYLAQISDLLKSEESSMKLYQKYQELNQQMLSKISELSYFITNIRNLDYILSETYKESFQKDMNYLPEDRKAEALLLFDNFILEVKQIRKDCKSMTLDELQNKFNASYTNFSNGLIKLMPKQQPVMNETDELLYHSEEETYQGAY